MKAHKYNIEHRMRLENRDYYPLAPPSLHRPIPATASKCQKQQRQCLDPSWYTDNIYSNQSIDLEEEDYISCHDLTDNNNDSFDSDDIFVYHRTKLKTVNITETSEYKYPKSSSCCFGLSNYAAERKIKPSLPKSHSFSTSTHHSRVIHDVTRLSPPASSELKTFNKYIIPQNPICDREGCVNESCFSKPITLSKNSKIYTSNEWDDDFDCIDDDPATTTTIPPRAANNGNQSEYFTADEDYYYDDHDTSSVYEFNPHPQHTHYIDDHSPTTPYFDDDINRLIQNERSKLLIQNKLNKYRDDHLTYYNNDDDLLVYKSHIKNKTLLEVQPPNKYDDSSPDSTDLELDDFNFDFIKYWEDLDDRKSPSPLLSPSSIDNNNNINKLNNNNNNSNLDNIINNNNASNINNNCCVISENKKIIKNINYDRSCYYNDNNTKLLNKTKFNHRKIYPSEINNNNNNNNSNKYNCNINNINNNIHINNNFYPCDSPPSSSTLSNNNSIINNNNINSSVNNNNNNISNNNITKSNTNNNNNNNNSSNSNAISLINNIFSIYKPNKYSPLNCHNKQNPTIANKSENYKKNNLNTNSNSKTEYLTSIKRPLLVNPQLNSAEHPRFKIIPDKTGLKITPLYRYDLKDYQYSSSHHHNPHHQHHAANKMNPALTSSSSTSSGYKLKSTSRPLLFRH